MVGRVVLDAFWLALLAEQLVALVQRVARALRLQARSFLRLERGSRVSIRVLSAGSSRRFRFLRLNSVFAAAPASTAGVRVSRRYRPLTFLTRRLAKSR